MRFADKFFIAIANKTPLTLYLGSINFDFITFEDSFKLIDQFHLNYQFFS